MLADSIGGICSHRTQSVRWQDKRDWEASWQEAVGSGGQVISYSFSVIRKTLELEFSALYVSSLLDFEF
jgi:hypothetical protein